MAGISDLIKYAVSTAVNNAAKTAEAVKNQVSSGGSGTNKTGTTSGSTTAGEASGSGTDWSRQMQSAMDRGASADVVEYLMNQRNNKIAANQAHYDTLGISGNDSISKAAQQYIDQKRAEQEAMMEGKYGSFQEFMADSGYSDYADQVKNTIKASVDQAVKGYQGQIDTTNQQSDELARQAWVAKRLAEKNLGQQLSASGYSGGMADSQKISLESDYQGQLTDIEKQRLQTVKDLESAITNAQLTGDMQAAQELSAMLQQLQSQWNSYVQNQKQLDASNYWKQKELDNQNYWNEQEMGAQNQENAYKRALNLISQGFMPDDETLTAAGISRQAAQQQIDQLWSSQGDGAAAQTAQETPGRTPGGGYNNGSLTSSQVMQLQKALGVTADGLWGSNSQAAAGGMTADEAWAAYQNQNPGTSRFSGLAYQTLIQNQQYDEADAYLAKYWDSMSDADRNRANIIANKYGPK